MNWRHWILLVTVVGVVAIVFLFPAIPQNESYHNFADHRSLFGIPNFLNVSSNIFFAFVGVLGLRFAMGKSPDDTATFTSSVERQAYLLFFLSVAVTAVGSAYYHLHPDDRTLVWYRLPMAVGFMALVAAVVTERTKPANGLRYLAALPIWGVWSVFYWSVTQARGHGDLRPYIIAQFGSLVVLLLLVALFPPRYSRGADLIVSLGFYALAKVFEGADHQIFALGGIVSGHTLKHIAAAASAYWILRMLRLRGPVTAPAAA